MPGLAERLHDVGDVTGAQYLRDARCFSRYFGDLMKRRFAASEDALTALQALAPHEASRILHGFLGWLVGREFSAATIDQNFAALRKLVEPGWANEVSWPPALRDWRRPGGQGTPSHDLGVLFRSLDHDGSARGLRDHALISLLHFAGLRPGEVAELEREDVWFDRTMLLIKARHWQRNTQRQNDVNEVPLRVRAWKPLLTWIRSAGIGAGAVFFPLGSHHSNTCMATRTINRILATRCEAARIPITTPRALRHAGVHRAIVERSPAFAERLARLRNRSFFLNSYCRPRREPLPTIDSDAQRLLAVT